MHLQEYIFLIYYIIYSYIFYYSTYSNISGNSNTPAELLKCHLSLNSTNLTHFNFLKYLFALAISITSLSDQKKIYLLFKEFNFSKSNSSSKYNFK
ncbi:hypothetical protein HOF65_01085 [bacterium]|nr:hypothetical protein [bacterium]